MIRHGGHGSWPLRQLENREDRIAPSGGRSQGHKFRSGLSRASTKTRTLHHALVNAHRGSVDQDAVRTSRARARFLGYRISFAHPAREVDFLDRGRKDVIGDVDLARMNRPFADGAEGRGPDRLAPVTLRVAEIANGPSMASIPAARAATIIRPRAKCQGSPG